MYIDGGRKERPSHVCSEASYVCLEKFKTFEVILFSIEGQEYYLHPKRNIIKTK